MHPCNISPLLYRLLSREEGLTMGEVMWSFAVVALIVALAYVLGPVIGGDWADFVGDPTP